MRSFASDIQELLTFNGARMFVTFFRRSQHWSLPEPDESSPHHLGHFLRIHSDILGHTLRFSKWFPSFRFLHQIFCVLFLSAYHMSRLSHLPLFNNNNNNNYYYYYYYIFRGVQIMELVVICFIPASFPEMQIGIFLPHPVLSLCSPFSVRDKVPHLHKTTGKIIIIYIYIYIY